MRFSIAKFFTKSPFVLLKTHMEKVQLCVDELPGLFKALSTNDTQVIQKITDRIFKLEHMADLTKNDIRNHLPKSLFLQIDKRIVLNILALQDAFANKAEDIGILTTLRPLGKYNDLKEIFEAFCKMNLEAFDLCKKVMNELDLLLETSFGGPEAAKVKEMTDDLALKEHMVDRMQYKLMKKLYSYDEKDMSFSSFHLWLTLSKEIGAISNIAENLGNQIRVILELKS